MFIRLLCVLLICSDFKLISTTIIANSVNQVVGIQDEPCIFPFIYNGESFNKCIPNDKLGFWCSLSPIYTPDSRYNWCQSEAPKSAPCSFPFIHDDKIYNSCALSVFNETHAYYWCKINNSSASWNHCTPYFQLSTCDLTTTAIPQIENLLDYIQDVINYTMKSSNLIHPNFTFPLIVYDYANSKISNGNKIVQDNMIVKCRVRNVLRQLHQRNSRLLNEQVDIIKHDMMPFSFAIEFENFSTTLRCVFNQVEKYESFVTDIMASSLLKLEVQAALNVCTKVRQLNDVKIDMSHINLALNKMPTHWRETSLNRIQEEIRKGLKESGRLYYSKIIEDALHKVNFNR